MHVPSLQNGIIGPVGGDPRWEAFRPFHEYLSRTFPLVYVPLPFFLRTCSPAPGSELVVETHCEGRPVM